VTVALWCLQKLGKDSVRKQAAQKSDVDRFSRKKLSEMEVRKQYQMKISNTFAAFENLNDSKNTHTHTHIYIYMCVCVYIYGLGKHKISAKQT
jgi:hypothetical protein